MNRSEKVKYVRIKMKMTQAEFSKASGIPMITIARWETTEAYPQPKSIGKFLDFCEREKIVFDNRGDINE